MFPWYVLMLKPALQRIKLSGFSGFMAQHHPQRRFCSGSCSRLTWHQDSEANESITESVLPPHSSFHYMNVTHYSFLWCENVQLVFYISCNRSNLIRCEGYEVWSARRAEHTCVAACSTWGGKLQHTICAFYISVQITEQWAVWQWWETYSDSLLK